MEKELSQPVEETFTLSIEDIVIVRDIVKPEINIDPRTMARPTDTNNCED